MEQADSPRSIPPRVLLGPPASATDEQFLAWHAEYLRCEEQDPIDDDEADALGEEASFYADLIIKTPGASRVACKVKICCLLYDEIGVSRWAAGVLRDCLRVLDLVGSQ